MTFSPLLDTILSDIFPHLTGHYPSLPSPPSSSPCSLDEPSTLCLLTTPSHNHYNETMKFNLFKPNHKKVQSVSSPVLSSTPTRKPHTRSNPGEYDYRTFTASSLKSLQQKIQPFLDDGYEFNPHSSPRPKAYFRPRSYTEPCPVIIKRYWVELRKKNKFTISR